MLTSTALVLMMTIPGLALFYGGMVRRKNVLATVAQSFAITCLVTVLWLVLGYSLAFTTGSTILGGVSRVFMAGMTIDSISGGTGPIFSLLPPENATGNYVKIVQRVPVKIALEPGENQDHQLRPGMNVEAKVYLQ